MLWSVASGSCRLRRKSAHVSCLIQKITFSTLVSILLFQFLMYISQKTMSKLNFVCACQNLLTLGVTRATNFLSSMFQMFNDVKFSFLDEMINNEYLCYSTHVLFQYFLRIRKHVTCINRNATITCSETLKGRALFLFVFQGLIVCYEKCYTSRD